MTRPTGARLAYGLRETQPVLVIPKGNRYTHSRKETQYLEDAEAKATPGTVILAYAVSATVGTNVRGGEYIVHGGTPVAREIMTETL